MGIRGVASAAIVVALVASAEAARLARPRHGFQMKMGRFTIRPGEDKEVCEYRRLPNRKPVDAAGFEVEMPAGAHHFVLWGYSGPVRDDAAFPAEIVERAGCTGLGPGELIPTNLFGQQTPNARLRFPPGVAVRIPARQQVWLNAHMKNFGGTDLVPKIRFNIVKAKRGTVRHYAEQLTVGNLADIRIPPGGTQRLVSEFTVPADLNVIQLSSHQHRLGTYVGVEHLAVDGTPSPLFENYDWEHPAERWWPTEPLRLHAGERLRFTCEWRNDEDREVRFGVETTDEMCFVTGYYWRDDGAPPLTPPGCMPQSTGLLCFVRQTPS